MEFLLCLLLSAPLHELPAIGVVEVNHVTDSQGGERFAQIIYRDTNGLIRDWRYLQSEAMVPLHGYAIWKENRKWLFFRALKTVETWTRTDPERDEAQWRPVSERKRLFDLDGGN